MGVEILNLFSIYEYLLLREKEFIYQFTALYVIILLLHLLNMLIEIYEFIKSFCFYFAFLFCRCLMIVTYEEKNIEREWIVLFKFISALLNSCYLIVGEKAMGKNVEDDIR